MLGREVNTPAYLMFPLPAKEHEDIDQFVAKLTRNIQTAHNAQNPAANNIETYEEGLRFKRSRQEKLPGERHRLSLRYGRIEWKL